MCYQLEHLVNLIFHLLSPRESALFLSIDYPHINYMDSAVIYKLLGFTAAMIGAPIGTYFLTLNSVFRGV